MARSDHRNDCITAKKNSITFQRAMKKGMRLVCNPVDLLPAGRKKRGTLVKRVLGKMGGTGLEPVTPSVSCWCASQLRQRPLLGKLNRSVHQVKRMGGRIVKKAILDGTGLPRGWAKPPGALGAPGGVATAQRYGRMMESFCQVGWRPGVVARSVLGASGLPATRSGRYRWVCFSPANGVDS